MEKWIEDYFTWLEWMNEKKVIRSRSALVLIAFMPTQYMYLTIPTSLYMYSTIQIHLKWQRLCIGTEIKIHETGLKTKQTRTIQSKKFRTVNTTRYSNVRLIYKPHPNSPCFKPFCIIDDLDVYITKPFIVGGRCVNISLVFSERLHKRHIF